MKTKYQPTGSQEIGSVIVSEKLYDWESEQWITDREEYPIFYNQEKDEVFAILHENRKTGEIKELRTVGMTPDRLKDLFLAAHGKTLVGLAFHHKQ